MGLCALPILFTNLGGEMIYILDQRLTAQSIPRQKAQKVLNDIISIMLNGQFLEELFTPQELYSKATLKMAVDKLAHASIMRLNACSMDKLYDLITMAVKFQVFICARPSDLLLVTLNHVDALRAMTDQQHVVEQVENLYRLLIKHYSGMSQTQFQLVRYALLNFFQDTHIRVSMFLKDKCQNQNGHFVMPTSGPAPFGTEIPGSVRYFNASGDMYKITHFQNGGHYQLAHTAGSTDAKGDRGTKLGTNIYSSPKEGYKNLEGVTPWPENQHSSEEQLQSGTLAKDELNVLAMLLGSCELVPQKAEFRLHLFDVNSDEKADSTIMQVKELEEMPMVPTNENDDLSVIMGEMENQSPQNVKQRDLLDLMDSTNH